VSRRSRTSGAGRPSPTSLAPDALLRPARRWTPPHWLYPIGLPLQTNHYTPIMSLAQKGARSFSCRLFHFFTLCLLTTACFVSSLPTSYESQYYSLQPLVARQKGKVCAIDFRTKHTPVCQKNWKYVFETVNGVRKFVRTPLLPDEKTSSTVPPKTNCGEQMKI
jgi:hypothetical protein